MTMPRAARLAALAIPLLAVTTLAACDDDGPDTLAGGSATPATTSDDAAGTTEPASTAPDSTDADTTEPGSTAPATSAPGGTEPEPDTGGSVSADDLDGRAFVATESTGHELVEDSVVRLAFADGSVSGTGGCNSFVATPYSIEDGTLVVEGPIGTTEMACEPSELMDQDTWLAELLAAEPAIALEGDTLTLSTDDDEVTFTDEQVTNPDVELTGTTWELEGLVSTDAVSTVPAGVRTPTLVIEADLVLVDTGCNTARGGVTVDDATMTFDPMASTRMACPGDASDVETHVLTVLDGTVDYELDGDQLTITNGDDGLVFRAAR